MTVRAWFTISAVVVVALAVAVAFQFLRPITPPGIVLHADGERIEGALEAACWPQRSGPLRCTRSGDNPSNATIPATGEFRVVLASPAQPRAGSIRVTDDDGETVLRTGWKRTIDYELPAGEYTLTAEAGDPDGAYVRYSFALTSVTR